MIVVDPDTGKRVILHRDAELEAELNRHHKSRECGHAHSEIRRAVVGGGQIQFKRQCVSCGEPVGSAIAHALAPKEAPAYDTEIVERRKTEYLAQREEILLKHLRRQKAKQGAYWDDYSKYLASPQWAAKRDLVLKRANYICEGCLENPASQVHHLSYKNKFREFLFELVAVCMDCHKRLHDGESVSEPAGPTELPDRPCADSNDSWSDDI